MFEIEKDKKKLFELDDQLEKLYPLVEYLRKKGEKNSPMRWAMNKVYYYIHLLRQHMSDYLEKLEELEKAEGKE